MMFLPLTFNLTVKYFAPKVVPPNVILIYFPPAPPGYQAPPEYLLQAAGPPGVQVHPTSTVAVRASTVLTRASLFSMPVEMTEVRIT